MDERAARALEVLIRLYLKYNIDEPLPNAGLFFAATFAGWSYLFDVTYEQLSDEFWSAVARERAACERLSAGGGKCVKGGTV